MKTKSLRLSGHAPSYEWTAAINLVGTKYHSVKTSGALTVRKTNSELSGNWVAFWSNSKYTANYDQAALEINAIAFSYQEPIAIRVNDTWLMHRSAYNHSRTTSRHANKIKSATNAITVNSAADFAFYDIETGRLRETATVLWEDGLTKTEALEAARLLLQDGETK